MEIFRKDFSSKTNFLNEIISASSKKKVVVVYDSMNNLSSEFLKILLPNKDNIKIKILGGLNPKFKQKFNNSHYQKRTVYSLEDAIKMVSFLEKMEAEMNPNWNELTKVLFVHNYLAKRIRYSDIGDGNPQTNDVNLMGLVTGRAVCSGYSLIFKEALNRVGIQSRYVNLKHKHSFNVVKIDGVEYPIDLTWDAYESAPDKGVFLGWFANADFLSKPSHQIRTGDEEESFQSNIITQEVLMRAASEIALHRMKRLSKTVRMKNSADNVKNPLYIIPHNQADLKALESICKFLKMKVEQHFSKLYNTTVLRSVE
jgi:hypothetical protein